MAVIDSDLRVQGIAGLCVADTATMPPVVSGHTNAATIMIGERVAHLVR
jgi:choline dehydrogenase